MIGGDKWCRKILISPIFYELAGFDWVLEDEWKAFRSHRL